MRTTWKYYYESVNGIVFVVDSTCFIKNSDLIGEIRESILKVMQETKE